LSILLKIDKLSAWYGDTRVLNEVDIEIKEGEIVALLGRNGMGKTTTLHSVCGIIEKVSGKIFFNNNLISNLPSYEISKKLLLEFGLDERINYKPLKLSGGEQQRVAIARSLVNNPDLILADEMTGNLDEDTANNIFKFFINYIEQNKKTLVYVTHNKTYSLLADEIYYFKNKKIRLKNE